MSLPIVQQKSLDDIGRMHTVQGIIDIFWKNSNDGIILITMDIV